MCDHCLASRQSIVALKQQLTRVAVRAGKLMTRLYQQKHAFYFRWIQSWKDHAEVCMCTVAPLV